MGVLLFQFYIHQWNFNDHGHDTTCIYSIINAKSVKHKYIYIYIFTKTQKWVWLTTFVSWCPLKVLIKNKKRWYQENCPPWIEKTLQKFNPRSLTSHSRSCYCKVSDRGLNFCSVISIQGGQFFRYHILLFFIKTLRGHQLTKAVNHTHFWVLVKNITLFCYFSFLILP